MSEMYESIKRGLEQAIEYAKGNEEIAIIHKLKPITIDVKALREKLGITKTDFAHALGISLTTLRHWERGTRQPQGPALALLRVIAEKPEVVESVLSQPKMMIVSTSKRRTSTEVPISDPASVPFGPFQQNLTTV
jgi:putative transcriptional regulator